MNTRFGSNRARGLMTALLSLGVLAGCTQDDPPVAPLAEAPQPAADLTLGLDVSALNARAGDRITVVITGESARLLGALSGTLSFRSDALRYLGQVVATESLSGKSPSLVFINDEHASRGLLALAAIDAEGFGRQIAGLAFEVLGNDYATGLKFEFSRAVTAEAVARDFGRVAYRGRSLQAAAISGDVRHLAYGDWTALLKDRVRNDGIARVPGDLGVNGLVYGDATLDGASNVLDALYMARASTLTDPFLAGTDAGSPNPGTGNPPFDRDAVVAGNVRPVSPIGVEADGSRKLDVFDALAIAQEDALIPQAVVGDPIPGRSTLTVDNSVSCPITSNTTLTSGKEYNLQVPAGATTAADSVCRVGTNGAGTAVTLTIQPGVKIRYSGTIVIDRNARILADCTFVQPCEFTRTVAQDGTGAKWGGLYINGNATVNQVTGTSAPAITGRNTGGGGFEKAGEGNTGLYGGDNDDDDSGILRYIRISHAGKIYSGSSETNSLTLQGVGRGTIIDFVHSLFGKDDGVEMFGGTVNLKHIISENAEDDGFDFVNGYTGLAQFVIIANRNCAGGGAAGCNTGIEADNNASDAPGEDPLTSTPRSNPTLYNFTIVNTAPTNADATDNAVHLRQGVAGKYHNIAILGWPTGLDFDGLATDPTGVVCGQLASGTLNLSHWYLSGNTADGATDGSDPNDTGIGTGTCAGYSHGGSNLEALILGDAARNITTGTGGAAGNLVAPFAVVADYRPTGGLAAAIGKTPVNPAGSTFFDTSANFIGAVKAFAGAIDPIVPWYAGWSYPTN